MCNKTIDARGNINMAHPRVAHHGPWWLNALDHLAFNNLKISALGA